MQRLTTFLAAVFLLACSSILFAQAGISNARSTAMGGAYTALASGVEAGSWNPANLGLEFKRKYRLNLFSVGVGLENNSFTLAQYNLYNGAHLSEEDKREILSSVPADGFRINLSSEVQAMGISFGRFAFTASGIAASDFSLSKDILDLVLNGNEVDRVYEIGSTFGEGWGGSSFALSVGFPIGRGAAGVSVKYLRGFAYSIVREASSNFMVNEDGFQGDGRIEVDHALGGNGLGFDVGGAAHLGKNWTLSAGLHDLYSYINWNKDTERFIYTLEVDSLSVENSDDDTLDSLFTDADETIDIDPFSSTLSPELRLGIARTGEKLTLSAEYVQGFARGPGVSTRPKVAVGSELRLIGVLPLRAGLAVGGKPGFVASAGFGLDFSVFSWNFAITSHGALASGKGIGMAFDWMFRL